MNKSLIVMLLSVVLCQGKRISMGRGMSISDEKKFKFYKTPATFENAKKICEQNNGRLAVINSWDEEQVLLVLWRISGPVTGSSMNLNNQAFIGLHYASSGKWLTTFNEVPDYVNWSSTWWNRQQPDTPNRQKCGSLLDEGKMDDVECFFKLAFFCENE